MRPEDGTELPETWHYGVVAKWWSEFNDDFRAHELPYFRRFVESGGEPALDVGCGTGRLLRPLLRAGLDVDGCDVSADMIELCRTKAEHEGLSPTLFVQPMHELDPPRSYRTIVVCGSFGLGSDRPRDRQALSRFFECLEPGGRLVLDIEVPYADARLWKYWLRDERASLPEAAAPGSAPRVGKDGGEYTLGSRVVAVNPLEQHVTMEIHAELRRDGVLVESEDRRLDIGLYFKHELLLELERAGFRDVDIHGDHVEAPPTAADDFLVFVAHR